MPTPIQHLVLAEELLVDPALPSTARALLAAERGAFLLGTIAPDVQTISRQPREATHFFAVPPTVLQPAHQVMLIEHPALARSRWLAPAHTAFIAGYIQHLTLDEAWIAHIFGPCFGPDATWGVFRERLLSHNFLRTWLDRRDELRVRRDVSDALLRVEPLAWLPFIADHHLRAWRDEIALQLAPGAPVHTLEVFAARHNVPPAEFRRVLDSPEEMQQRVFARLRPGCVERFYADALAESVSRIGAYLGGN
jgi:hypothetical protein